MKRLIKIYAFLIYLLCFQFSTLYSIELSDSSRVSLLTCSPGVELYSAFGHNGIRVTDFKQHFDVVFNYGTFDFAQPGFYTNFVKGKMLYMISTDRFDDFLYQYTYEKRMVSEQELNLQTEDKKKIFAFLFNNALPENREYYYDFFWDNCATRIRDVFEKILGKRIEYHLDSKDFPEGKSMHDMLQLYVSNRPWVDFGFDLILGMPCEINATPRDQTFLPDYLAKYFNSATIDGEPFVLTTETILTFPPPQLNTPIKPIHLTLLIAFIGLFISFLEFKKKRRYYTFDFLLFFATGALGSLFLSLWVFSSHYSVPENLNLLWLIPTHLIVSFLLITKVNWKWMRYYFIFTAVIMGILLLGWKWIPQYHNIAFIPLILILLIRSVLIALSSSEKKR